MIAEQYIYFYPMVRARDHVTPARNMNHRFGGTLALVPAQELILWKFSNKASHIKNQWGFSIYYFTQHALLIQFFDKFYYDATISVFTNSIYRSKLYHSPGAVLTESTGLTNIIQRKSATN